MSYRPAQKALAVMLAGGVILGRLAMHLYSTGDHAGGGLLFLGAVLLELAFVWAIAGPVVALSEDGISVRSMFGRRHFMWAQVQTCAATKSQRRGLTQRNFELESGEQLILLPDWLVGGADALDALVAEAATLQSRLA